MRLGRIDTRGRLRGRLRAALFRVAAFAAGTFVTVRFVKPESFAYFA